MGCRVEGNRERVEAIGGIRELSDGLQRVE